MSNYAQQMQSPQGPVLLLQAFSQGKALKSSHDNVFAKPQWTAKTYGLKMSQVSGSVPGLKDCESSTGIEKTLVPKKK